MHKVRLDPFSRSCTTPVPVWVCVHVGRRCSAPGTRCGRGTACCGCVQPQASHLPASLMAPPASNLKKRLGLEGSGGLHETRSQRFIYTKRKITDKSSIYHFSLLSLSLSSLIFEFPASFSPQDLVPGQL